MKRLRYFSYLLLLTAFGSATHAAVIFSDFDPANVTYYGGWGIYGINNSLFPGAYEAMAMAFTPSFNAALTNIDVAIALLSGTNSVVLSLDSDNSGAPASTIESWTLNDLQSFDFCCTAESVTATTPVILQAGTQYWIVASPGASDTDAVWTDTNSEGLIADQDGPNHPFSRGSSSVESAFEVDGNPTPEPAAFLLAAAGIVVAAGVRPILRQKETLRG